MERHRGICTSFEFKGGEKRGKTGSDSSEKKKASGTTGETAGYIR